MNKRIEKILLDVEKPGRYTGGEYNTPDMDKPGSRHRFLMCFPDVYEIGMCNLGVSILYGIINNRPLWTAERCFAVKDDMAAKLRENDISLFSLETKSPVKDFDIIGFSIQYELLYTNVLYMLDLAGIPFYAKDRGEEFPLLIAGGPCTVNPEPFADFFDIVVIGEGEDATAELCALYEKCREQGKSKTDFLKEAKTIQGVYVPAMFEEGDIVKKAVVKDFEKVFYPSAPLVPNIEIVHNRLSMELYRGCASGCRFCQAGFWYRPIREKTAKTVVDCCKMMVESTGFDELTLSSLSTGDYSHLKDVMDGLDGYVTKKRVKVALPSLRLNSFEESFADNARKSSLTFAPEAGTQRLRDVINKNITDKDIENIALAFKSGYRSVKLYFMLGLPTETKEDLMGIAEICARLRNIYIEINKRKDLNISVSCAVFVPKPGTPFQWERQISLAEMLEKQAYLRGLLRDIKGVTFSWHGAETSRLEGVFAKGDRKLAKVIERAYKKGCHFDGWTEFFNWQAWEQSFFEEGIDMDAYLQEIQEDAVLPWDFIDSGVSKQYLLCERQKSKSGEATKNCRESCNACGANSLGRCFP